MIFIKKKLEINKFKKNMKIKSQNSTNNLEKS